jgi:uncharacterized protein (TIGR02217 family)
MISVLGLNGCPSTPKGFQLYSAKADRYVDANVSGGITPQSVFFNAVPAVATGDEAMVSSVDAPPGYAMSLLTNGIPVIIAGGDGSRQSFTVDLYDYSQLSWGGAQTDWVNNTAPVALNPLGFVVLNCPIGVTITPLVLSNYVTDVNGDNFPAGTMAFSISPNALDPFPSWATLSGQTITGTPNANGSNDVMFRATDIAGDILDFDITFNVGPVANAPTLVGTISNQSWIVGTTIVPLDTSGFFLGETSYAEVGALPSGITFVNGVFTGTPTGAGSFSGIVVTAINATGSIDQTPFTITVATSGGGGSAPTDVGLIPNQNAEVNFPITPLLLSNYFDSATSYSIASGTLPPGITLNAGILTGIPTVVGAYAGIVFRGTNSIGSVSQTAITWTIVSVAANVFPSFIQGLTWDIVRTPCWNTGLQTALSGKASTISYQQYPLYEYELTYELLRNDRIPSDLKSLVGFFNSCQGQAGSFLYVDPTYNSVSQEPFGTGDGVTKAFQLVAAFRNSGAAGQAEIIQNLSGSPQIFANGALVSSALYTVGVTGIITSVGTFAAGVVLTWTGSFYYRCRFTDDTLATSQFLTNWWNSKAVKFKSIVL